MRCLALIPAILAVLLLAAPGRSAPRPCPQACHDAQILRFFAARPRLAATPAGLRQIILAQQRQIARLRKDVRALQSAKASRAPDDPAALEAYVRRTDPCLANIIEHESAGTWDVTIDLGMGHGDTSGPYGLGQANPGTKMAAFGDDWRTSAETQLAWARSYAAERFGSTCGAWEFWQRGGWW